MSIWPMYNLEFKKKYAISCSYIYIYTWKNKRTACTYHEFVPSFIDRRSKIIMKCEFGIYYIVFWKN